MLRTKYDEYERLEQQKLLMELLGVSSQEAIEQRIQSDMLDFTEYMNTHLNDFFNNQIDAFSNFNTIFGEFLAEYKSNLEQLRDINTSEVNVISADDYLGNNDDYLDIPDSTPTTTIKKKVEADLYDIVLNDKEIGKTGALNGHLDSNGFVDYAQAATEAYNRGDVGQATYDLVLRQAKINGIAEDEKYASDYTNVGSNEELVKAIEKTSTDSSNKTSGAINDLTKAYANAQTTANRFAERELAITTDMAQFTIALASNLPNQLSKNAADQLIQSVESTNAFTGTVDSVGVSVNGTLTSNTSTIVDKLAEGTDKLVEYLQSIDDSLTKEEAEAAVNAAIDSYSSSGGGGGGDKGYTSNQRSASSGSSNSSMSSSEKSAASTIAQAKSDWAAADSAYKAGKISEKEANAAKEKAHETANTARTSIGIKESDINKDGTLKKHDGMESGLIGNVPIDKGKEVIIKALKGEGVFTDEQMDAIANALQMLERVSNVGTKSVYTGLSSLADISGQGALNMVEDDMLKYMSLKKPAFESAMDVNNGDNWTLNGDVILENCDDPVQFWNEVTKAMSNRYNVTKNKK